MTKEELKGAHERITRGEELLATYEDLADELETLELTDTVITISNSGIEIDGTSVFEGGKPIWEFDFLLEIVAFKKAVAKKVQKTIDKIKREFDKL